MKTMQQLPRYYRVPSSRQQESAARGGWRVCPWGMCGIRNICPSACAARRAPSGPHGRTFTRSSPHFFFFTPHYHPPTTTITPLTPLRLSTTPAHPACPPGRPLRALCSTLVSVAQNEWRNGPPPPRGIPASGAITEPAGKTMSFHSLPRETTRLQSARTFFCLLSPG